MKIVMKLKSDAIPGSGSSLAGIIDRDIVYDKYGLPYIPAKRIKGVLRESAEDLGVDEKELNELFGTEGSEKSCDFVLDNGYLSNYRKYKKLLSSISDKKKISDFLPTQAVLDYFTYTRSQTTIENGIAKENSLRVSRVLKKGLAFEFNVNFNKEYATNIDNICKVTRAFGSSRTRGFGEIELKLDNSESAESSKTYISDGRRLKLIVKNEGQLLISSKPGMSQTSENFITGSTILGAIASNYIKQNGVDEKFNELFLSGKVSFGNLYPTTSETLFYPAPLSVKKVKEDKDNIAKEEYYDHACLEDESIEKNVIFKGGFAEFVNGLNSNKVNIVKNIEAHHRRNSDRHIAKSTKKDGDFYQFEVIEPGQTFAGEIIGNETLLKELVEYFPKNNILRLGKSKTGQYGKCSFKFGNNSENSDKVNWERGDSIKFIFRSDMILIHENGFATPDINLFKKELANKLGVATETIEITKQFLKTTNTGGFMGVWKMPRIQKPAISAGTVVEIMNNSDEAISLKDIETLFFGDRDEDGFGRISVYKNDKAEVSKPVEEEKEKNIYKFDESTSGLINFQVEKIVKRNLQAEAVKHAKPIKINSFIGKIVAFLKSVDSFENFNKKLKEINSDKQKSNLKKIEKEKYLYIKDAEVNEDKFSNDKVVQMQSDLPEKIREKFMIKSDFKLYQHYALSYLTQVKYLNRGGEENGR